MSETITLASTTKCVVRQKIPLTEVQVMRWIYVLFIFQTLIIFEQKTQKNMCHSIARKIHVKVARGEKHYNDQFKLSKTSVKFLAWTDIALSGIFHQISDLSIRKNNSNYGECVLFSSLRVHNNIDCHIYCFIAIMLLFMLEVQSILTISPRPLKNSCPIDVASSGIIL